MTLDAFIEGIRSGKITIDMMGHEDRNHETLIENLLKRAGDVRPFYEKALNKPIPENCPTYHDYCRAEFEKTKSEDFTRGDMPLFLITCYEWRCPGCGESLYLYWKNNNSLVLARWDCDTHNQAKPCELSHGRLPATHNIQIPTGKLLFANYFNEFKSCDDKDKYTTPWSLESYSGRTRIMGYLADQNVGCGQWGNMSVNIYISPDRKRIVVLQHDLEHIDEHYEEVPTNNPAYDEAKQLITDGYKYLGDISLAVWRVMFADRSVLEAASFQEIEHMDYVDADVVPGTWNVTHFYDSDMSEKTIVGTELILVD